MGFSDKTLKISFFEKFEVPITVLLKLLNETDRNGYGFLCHTPLQESGGQRISLPEGKMLPCQRLKTDRR